MDTLIATEEAFVRTTLFADALALLAVVRVGAVAHLLALLVLVRLVVAKSWNKFGIDHFSSSIRKSYSLTNRRVRICLPSRILWIKVCDVNLT